MAETSRFSFLQNSYPVFCINFLERNTVEFPMVNLNRKIKKSLPFPDLSLDEQEESIKHLAFLFAKADKIQEKYELLKSKIDHLPRSILHKAFKGELVPQLESDGNASKLLREIEQSSGDYIKKAYNRRKKMAEFNEKFGG